MSRTIFKKTPRLTRNPFPAQGYGIHARRSAARASSLPPLAKRVAGRPTRGAAQGWGALPRGASLTIRRGCRWLPWPNRRNTLVALSPRPATPHPTPPRHSASPSGGREEREADMCESGSPEGRGRLGQVELWLAGAVAFLATFVASSSSPPFRCAPEPRGKRWLKPLRKRVLCGSSARYRCHSGAPRSGEPGTHNHGGWTVAQSSQTRVFMGSGLALRAPRNDSEIAKSPFAEARKAGAINLRRVPPRCSPAGRGAR